ncbi:MAG: trypsin-like peptidase domain-containing protein [Erythrobacter sp.]|nr:trypsin-like peptidase domain-containing protein [Erythrobacter sp.]
MSSITIDSYTTVSSRLEMRFDDTILSFGTCFFWREGEDCFLVTNWHNLSGINPITGKHLSNTLAEPNKIQFDVWINQDLNKRGFACVPIENEDGPLWLEHPIHRKSVDVVCLRLPADISPHVFPINKQDQQPLVTRIADEVFVLGFPMGVGPEKLPVWKRASVASEPDIDVDRLPKFLIDTATAQGMSGSPVVHRTTAGLTEDGSMSMFAGPVSRFVGVYSGRLTSGNSLEAQLGLVWKSRVIGEIIAGTTRGLRR